MVRNRATSAKNTAGTRRVVRRVVRERRQIRTFMMVAAVGLIAIFSILAAGFYVSFIGPPRQVAVKVNDTSYTLGYIVKILRSFQFTSGSSGLDYSRAPFDVVQLVTENEIVRQSAPSLSLTVSGQEITDDIRKSLMGPPKDGDTTPQSQLDREFKERYSRLLTGSKLSEKAHRQLVSNSLLREKVRERVSSEIAAVAPQYHLYSLTVDNEQQAKEARTEFERGLSFKELVAKYSKDAEAVRKEGEAGWIARGLFGQMDQLADKLAINQLSELTQENVQAQAGRQGSVKYTMYLISEKVDAKEITDDQKRVFKEQAMQKWISEQRTKSIVETKFGTEEYNWVVKQLRKTAPPQQPAQS